ncbi:Asp-tRNA(Asn)/Glu-tRNA(Gln) amidotransferase subunit GatC [Aquisalimonas asiatica]|uniref:Aspartyl/glutamyl-tRNA(Asn/Gln) amidotransferase subunit C n=1 Tax=Aquisalimonas asiatica TaxID=406100 RepID=A0A1H8VCM9_9GAMM|nr:Asp-tRNA(Asn)/Glu-tRNA(Gln) amidotransferase subunit GatC [Aquisalimonas asiatica]SEP13091.1 aspartyl/glutamyl-tRNA(Asn/Gln) amidotransferase subunit C [Aquisalimonas asiatica]
MSLSNEQVNEIAHLARLQVDEADLPEYARNLSDILSFVEAMNAMETDSVEPLAHPLEMPQRLREDAVTEENQREQFQAVAPQVEAGLYLVPRVIE